MTTARRETRRSERGGPVGGPACRMRFLCEVGHERVALRADDHNDHDRSNDNDPSEYDDIVDHAQDHAPDHAQDDDVDHPATTPPSTSSAPVTSTPSTALPPLASPAGGLVVGHVTAVGDSVMLDYQSNLQTDVPGVDVEAAVSRQWATGEQLLQQLRSEGRLGAVVVVALGTNGPITSADFDAMMSVLSGASRVVFVNIVVDRSWQDPNNQVLASGVAQYSNAVIADWHSLESQNPSWVYSDGTHLPIGGAGAQALAALIASKV